MTYKGEINWVTRVRNVMGSKKAHFSIRLEVLTVVLKIKVI
jgi:hypothetical protein